MKVGNMLAEFQRTREGVFLASVKEAKMTLAEMHSSGALAVLAPVNLNEKGINISVRVQDRNGCMQSQQRFLHPSCTRVQHFK